MATQLTPSNLWGLDAGDTAATFLDARLLEWGTGVGSNLETLNTWIDTFQTDINNAKTNQLFTVDATPSTTNVYYRNGVVGITSYYDGLKILLSISVTVTGSATLNINSLGARAINKPAVGGSSIPLESGDMEASVYYLATYNGTFGVFILSDVVYKKMMPQEGFLINGRILTSVTSNNLTVALKTAANNNPSVGDPVYVRIGNVLRKITSTLSVTKNAGTNWFNSGSSELAGLETDYFAYLGYNATDGVTIGFSRIPGARIYSDFSATSTNDKYCAISTITNAVNSDVYVNVGRFDAILSASAAYNWTIGSNTIVNYPIFETRWLNWNPTFTGFSANPTALIHEYKITRSSCELNIRQTTPGTSNATGFTMTSPMTSKTITNMVWISFGRATDNGAVPTTPASLTIASNTTTINAYKDAAVGTWTASGNKAFSMGNLKYDIF